MREQPESFAAGREFEFLCRYFSELSPQPMIAVEGTTHVVRYVNEAFSRLVRMEQAELVGRCFSEAVPEGDENKCFALLDRVYCTGKPEVLAEQEHSKMPPVYWTYSVWPILGPDSSPVGVMINVTDATEIAIYRKEMVAINERLLISSTRQHELIEAAENANRVKDEFLATLSHELRTPLTVVIGWSDMLQNPKLDSSHFPRAIESIRRNARMQVQMIDDLLDVSRIITGKLRLDTELVDIQTVAIATVDALRPTAEAKGISWYLQLDSPMGQVVGDPDRLQQVIWNLVSNAIKFTPEGGSITVKLKRVESNVEFSVRDTGKGIAPEFLPFVFERFRQSDSTTTRAHGGLGLGLSIVRQLVELHGGTVRVASEGENLGATFTVSLPLISLPGADSDTEYSTPPEYKAPRFECPSELERLRVLVVDDEEDTCYMLQFILEGCGTYVKTASSAAAALEAVTEEVFDVLLIDIAMPEEDGYSLIAKIRALGDERGNKIPAAALTAYASEKDRIRVLRAGFQMHVPKPISPSELVAVVVNLAGRTGLL
jgi:PAS domain S-box-containing protein